MIDRAIISKTMQAYLDREARESLYALLSQCHPGEVSHLLEQLRAGLLDGYDGERCLIGHVAHYRRSDYLASALSGPDTWPIERWLRAFNLGDTPDNHEQAKLLEGWITSWLSERTIEVAPQRVEVGTP